MISHAPEKEGELLVGVFIQKFPQLVGGVAVDRVVPLVRAVDGNLRPVESLPDKVVLLESVGLPAAVDDIAVEARLAENLHQDARMAEGVEVDGGRGAQAELLGKIFPPGQDVADKGFSRRHVAVGLKIPAAHNAPAAGLHQALDVGKEGGVVLLHPGVEKGLIMIEDEVGILVQNLHRRAEGREGFGTALLPPPEPDGVKMGVCDQMDGLHIYTSFFAGLDAVRFKNSGCGIFPHFSIRR